MIIHILFFFSWHQKIKDEKWDTTGVSDHASTCGFCWTERKLLKTEKRSFERKVREALEIQLQQTSPYSEQGHNQDNGKCDDDLLEVKRLKTWTSQVKTLYLYKSIYECP